MKCCLFLLIILSHSFLVAMEREPARKALVTLLIERYGSDDIQGAPAPEDAYGVMDQWCKSQQASVRVRLWSASTDPVESRTIQHMSLVDLLHIERSFSSPTPVPVSITEALNNERLTIWEQTVSGIQKARQPKEVILEIGTGQAVGEQRDEDESGCCSCVCLREFFACVKKKDQ